MQTVFLSDQLCLAPLFLTAQVSLGFWLAPLEGVRFVSFLARSSQNFTEPIEKQIMTGDE